MATQTIGAPINQQDAAPKEIEEMPNRPAAPPVTAGCGLVAATAQEVEQPSELNQGQGGPQVINPATRLVVKR